MMSSTMHGPPMCAVFKRLRLYLFPPTSVKKHREGLAIVLSNPMKSAIYNERDLLCRGHHSPRPIGEAFSSRSKSFVKQSHYFATPTRPRLDLCATFYDIDLVCPTFYCCTLKSCLLTYTLQVLHSAKLIIYLINRLLVLYYYTLDIYTFHGKDAPVIGW